MTFEGFKKHGLMGVCFRVYSRYYEMQVEYGVRLKVYCMWSRVGPFNVGITT